MRENGTLTIQIDDLEEMHHTPCLNLPDITEDACYKHKAGLPYRLFTCSPAKRYMGTCPACGGRPVSIHGYLPRPRLVHDVNLGIEQTDLYVKVPRYRCESCGHTFAHTFESISILQNFCSNCKCFCYKFIHYSLFW